MKGWEEGGWRIGEEFEYAAARKFGYPVFARASINQLILDVRANEHSPYTIAIVGGFHTAATALRHNYSATPS